MMENKKILRIYLDEAPLSRARKGEFNLINLVRQAFEARGFRVEYIKNSLAERIKSASRNGYSLFHMEDPFHPRALTLRRAYYYPFWRIESSAKRWEWSIAKSNFDPAKIDCVEARNFCRFRRKQLFGLNEIPTAPGGSIYIPLQGRLMQRRSFQSLSPLEMIATVLKLDPGRQIYTGLHPNETYLPEEIAALRAMADTSPRLTVSTAPMTDLLASCDYVVTENSSVALAGYFFHKPAVLFAKIDFHHIAANVAELGVEAALRTVPTLAPDYDRYMYWFLQMTCINTGQADAEDRILEMVRRKGWRV